jgi:hypothetical protein
MNTDTIYHIYMDRQLFKHLENYSIIINTANSSSISKGRGVIVLILGKHTIELQNVLYNPDIKINVILTERFRIDNGIGFNFYPNYLYHGNSKEIIVKADFSSGLPLLNVLKAPPRDRIEICKTYYSEIKHRPISINLAHRRLNYISEQSVRKLALGKTEGPSLLPEKAKKKRCDHSYAGQMKRFPHLSRLSRHELAYDARHAQTSPYPVDTRNWPCEPSLSSLV